jgi:hypothetical protein
MTPDLVRVGMSAKEIYMPPNCRTLDTVSAKQQVRLGIQGFPGVGKTWAALTFPNPIVLNLDRGLGAHQGRKDVIEIPFYEKAMSGGKTELKDKLLAWIEKEGPKLEAEQTLIIDGLSSIEISYHAWFAVNQHLFLTKQGKVDDFAEYQVKKKYLGEIFDLAIKSFRCDIILISHEAERADKPTTIGQPGEYTGKIRPLLTGAYGDTIVKDFTDWFRQHAAEKPRDFAAITPEALAAWGMKTTAEFKAMCDTFPRNTIYYWQCDGDNRFDGKAGSLVGFPKFIPANYQSFQKYMRKVQV